MGPLEVTSDSSSSVDFPAKLDSHSNEESDPDTEDDNFIIDIFRFAALNDGGSSEEDTFRSAPVETSTTKEAQESDAFTLYNQALDLQKQGDIIQAKATFLKLLNCQLVQEASPRSHEDEGLVHPGLLLKYSTLKNLASLATQKNDHQAAMEFYLEAVTMDSSDVTVWYKVGTMALKLNQYTLARHAFEQGLICNPKHWPCLDNVITILYALNNYEVCLVYIARALERDPGFIKGAVFMEKIFSEQKSLKEDTAKLFAKCDSSIYDSGIEQEDIDEFIGQALEMRRKKREREKLPDIPVLKFTTPLNTFTWKCLGDCLITLYDHIQSSYANRTQTDLSKPRISFGCRVDLSAYVSGTLVTPVNVPMTNAGVDSSFLSVPAPEITGQLVMQIDSTFGPRDSGMEVDGNQSGSKKTLKRKRLVDDDPAGKRRSARVRNTTRKKLEEVINFPELLRSLLPVNLLEVPEGGEDEEVGQSVAEAVNMSTFGASQGATAGASGVGPPSDATSDALNQDTAVLEFIRAHQANSGVIDLLNEYLVMLANNSHTEWPSDLTSTYIEAYNRLRKHIEYPNFLCKDVTDERIKDMGLMCLVQLELKVDKWIDNRSKLGTGTGGSPRRSPAMHSSKTLGPDFPGEYFTTDLSYLLGLTTCHSILDSLWQQFCIRVYWMRARFLIVQNKLELAVESFGMTTDYLKLYEDSQDAPYVLKLPNCKCEAVVTAAEVTRQLDCLQRCQSLDEVQRLYDAGNYEKVITLLLQTFPQGKVKVVEIDTKERHAQLLLLQDSLLKLEDYKRCLYWTEVSFNEALQKYLCVRTSSMKDDWVNTMMQLFEGLNTCLSRDAVYCGTLPPSRLVRLVQNLIKVIDIAMDVSESAPEMAIETMWPWILLYKLSKWATGKQRGDGDGAMGHIVTASFMLLSVAHEYLGRRSWCVTSDGALLHFFVDILMEELRKISSDDPLREHLVPCLEQCFYCLYGHPNKRAKAKHLQDHNVPQVTLTWERAQKAFEYFKPKTMPEYDSYRTSTVSGELENLLRRISLLVPQQKDPKTTVESVQAYIEGVTKVAPLPEGKNVIMPVVDELFYLLGDYYFKNKEPSKAIKFYMHDICVKPERFDSWAGMSLARASRLEQKLNSHELKAEAPIQRQAISTLRCFKRALELDGTNSKLWIEYGSLAYQLHSHASRQLKHAQMFGLGQDVVDLAMTNKPEMLRVAENCYKKAAECETDETAEEWLHHYMLGKVAEKLGSPPQVYLEHYTKAAHFLHEERAKYPKKITYIYSPPHLAIESLEAFYRIHNNAIKYLMSDKKEPLLPLFEKYVDQATNGPFANCKEKDRPPPRKPGDRFDSDGNIINTSTPIRAKRKRVFNDHTYFKQKLSSESSELSSQESMDASQESLTFASSTPQSMSSPPHSMAALLRTSQTTKMSSAFSPEVTNVTLATPDMPRVGRFQPLSPPVVRPQAPSTFSMASILGNVAQREEEIRQKIRARLSSRATLYPPEGESNASNVRFSTQNSGPKALLDLESLQEPMDLSVKVRDCSSTALDTKSSAKDHVKPSDVIKTEAVAETDKISPEVKPTDWGPSAGSKVEADEELSFPDIPEGDLSLALASSDMDDTDTEMKILAEFGYMDKESQAVSQAGDVTDKKNERSVPSEQEVNTVKHSTPLASADATRVPVEESVPESKDVKMEPETINATDDDDEMHSDELPGLSFLIAEAEKLENLFEEPEVPHAEGKKTGDEVRCRTSEPKTDTIDLTVSSDDTDASSSCNQPERLNDKATKYSPRDLKAIPEDSAVSSQPDTAEEVQDPKDKPAEDSKKVDEPTQQSSHNPVTDASDAHDKTVEKSEFLKAQEKLDDADRRCKLMDVCIDALSLCLSRFPQHYKAMYRLAYVYFRSSKHKNLQKARDLLFGNHQWQQLPHMSCPGLFQDRKQTNFFQGLWRIPVEEFDRCGSFATHIAKSLFLLFDILREDKDSKTLFYIHQQLARSPELGKKYIRDADRLCLSRVAYDRSIEAAMLQVIDLHSVTNKEKKQQFLLNVYKIWQHGVRMQTHVDKVNSLLVNTYKCCQTMEKEATGGCTILEQAIRYCQQIVSVKPPSSQASSEGSKHTSGSQVAPPAQTPRHPSEKPTVTSTWERSGGVSMDPETLTSAVQAKVPRLLTTSEASVTKLPVPQQSPNQKVSPQPSPTQRANASPQHRPKGTFLTPPLSPRRGETTKQGEAKPTVSPAQRRLSLKEDLGPYTVEQMFSYSDDAQTKQRTSLNQDRESVHNEERNTSDKVEKSVSETRNVPKYEAQIRHYTPTSQHLPGTASKHSPNWNSSPRFGTSVPGVDKDKRGQLGSQTGHLQKLYKVSPPKQAHSSVTSIRSPTGSILPDTRVIGSGHQRSELETRLTGLGHQRSEAETRLTGLSLQRPNPETRVSGLGQQRSEPETRVSGLGHERPEPETRASGLAYQRVPAARVSGLGHQRSELETRLTGIGHERPEPETRVSSLGHQRSEPETRITGLGPERPEPETRVSGLGLQRSEPVPRVIGLGHQRPEPEAKASGLGYQRSEPETRVSGLSHQRSEPETRLTGLGHHRAEPEAKLTGFGHERTMTLSASQISPGGSLYKKSPPKKYHGAGSPISARRLPATDGSTVTQQSLPGTSPQRHKYKASPPKYSVSSAVGVSQGVSPNAESRIATNQERYKTAGHALPSMALHSSQGTDHSLTQRAAADISTADRSPNQGLYKVAPQYVPGPDTAARGSIGSVSPVTTVAQRLTSGLSHHVTSARVPVTTVVHQRPSGLSAAAGLAPPSYSSACATGAGSSGQRRPLTTTSPSTYPGLQVNRRSSVTTRCSPGTDTNTSPSGHQQATLRDFPSSSTHHRAVSTSSSYGGSLPEMFTSSTSSAHAQQPTREQSYSPSMMAAAATLSQMQLTGAAMGLARGLPQLEGYGAPALSQNMAPFMYPSVPQMLWPSMGVPQSLYQGSTPVTSILPSPEIPSSAAYALLSQALSSFPQTLPSQAPALSSSASSGESE